MTPQEVLLLSESVEKMYADCASQLIINIAGHFKTGRGLETQEWQIKKLSELGQLTQESVEIIARYTGEAPETVRATFEKAVGMTLGDVEKTLREASEAGKIATAAGDIFTSERIKTVLTDYINQAKEDFNLVNTVMLESTANRYRAAIAGVVQFEEAALIESLTSSRNTVELSAQLGKAQEMLNEGAGSVAMSTATRQQALRQAIKTMAANGITGFIDRGGHHWTPEAYVNMDIRTTVHNVAIEAQKARSADYGVDTFQISVKAAARPLCYPYQGWVCSWTNYSRMVEDLNGDPVLVHAISETSYGEPAGIFGINCGHFPNTFVPGWNVLTYTGLDAVDEAVNERQYKLSQQQRAKERKVRKLKTEAAAYDAAGDREAFDKTALKVKAASNEYKIFCRANGLTMRVDRTQVIGYNRSISSKATATTRSIATADGLNVRKTLHSIEQAAKRNISNDAIRDALKKPLQITPIKYRADGLLSKTYIGRFATVAVNPDNGNITTVHGTHSKVVKKLTGG